MEGIIKLAGLNALPAIMIYIGYLFYNENFIISVGLVIIGVILAISVISNEIECRKKEAGLGKWPNWR